MSQRFVVSDGAGAALVRYFEQNPDSRGKAVRVHFAGFG